jgi:hypothetical protein
MMSLHRVLAIGGVLLTLAASGCAGAGQSGGAPAVDQTLITRVDLDKVNATNLFDAIMALRGNWLRPRASDSFDKPSVLQVYQDNQRIGGVNELRLIQPRDVASVRFYDGIQATARWGMDHAAGAIAVTLARAPKD